MRVPMVPAEWTDVPGVWQDKNGSAGRVPLNAAETLELSHPHSMLQQYSIDSILGSVAFLPWVGDILMDHQRAILEGAFKRPGYHAWSPPGSGKTLCGLVWLAAAKQKLKVVITKAGARGTWREEIRKYTRFTPIVLSGRGPKEKVKTDPRCIYITAWETLIDWREALCKLNIHSLVLDEIHWAKNHKRVMPVVESSGRTRFDPLGNTASAIKEIAHGAQRTFGLTATPIPNRTKDLWAQLDLVEPWCWGTFHQFGERYCAGFKDIYGWKYDGLSEKYELLERLNWSRYKTDQQAISQSLPAKRRQVVYLEHSEQNAPSGFKRDIARAGKTGDRESIFEVMLQEAASRKKKYVIERVQEAVKAGQKVVVFTGRRKDCDILGKTIKDKVGSEAIVFCAHGGTTTDKRDDIRHDYMNTKGAAVLVGTGDAWGESVNLQDTDLALFVMLPWTPRAIRQWEGRFARLGQKRPVLVSYIIGKGTVDEHVADVLIDKLPAVGAVAEDETAQEISEALDGDASDLLSRIAGLP